jgi:transposase
VELPKLAIQMKEKSMGAKRRKYDASFKEEVLKMVFNGRGVSEVAQSLGIGENLIYRWKSRYQKQHFVAASRIEDISLTEEQQVLHRRIKELEMERDILKKALGIFSRQT